MGLPLLLALTIPDRSGGPRVTLALVDELVRRGHRVTLIHGAKENAEGTLLPELRAAGAELRPAPFLRFPLGPLPRRALMRLLRETGARAAVSCQVRDCAITLSAAAAAGVPAVALAQNTRNFTGPAPAAALKRRMYRAAFLRARPALIAVGEAVLRQHVDDFGAPADRAHWIPTGIDLAAFAPSGIPKAKLAARLGLPNDGPLVVSIGRLQAQKGHDLAFEALSRIPGPWTYAIAGGAGESESERAFAETLRLRAARPDLAGRVHLLGWVDRPRDPAEAADLLVHPSRWEGGCPPLSVQEGMALGTPALFSDCAGLPPGFVLNHHGFAHRAGDADDLAARLHAALSLSASDLATVGAAGRAYALDHFDHRVFAATAADVVETEAGRAFGIAS